MLSTQQPPVGLTPALAGAEGAPRLVMADPEDQRASWVSGSLTTLLHLLAIGVIALISWMAPPVEELIEVKIIRELPGSNEEPAPARRVIQPRRPQRQIHAARRIQAQAVTAPRAVKINPQQLNLQQLDKGAAPRKIERRQVTSTRTQARAVEQRRVPTNVDLSKLQNVDVAPTALDVPQIDYDGPIEVDPGAAIIDPASLQNVPQVQDVDYRSAGPVEVESPQDSLGAQEAFEFDMDVGVYAGGEGTGGTGTAVGVVRCLESAFVVRYMQDIAARTQRRWQVPQGTADNASVVLHFALDASGAATRVEYRGKENRPLGTSAANALREASPFPPMDDNVRCLAGRPLTGIFSVPAL